MGLFDYPDGATAIGAVGPGTDVVFLNELPAAAWKQILAHAQQVQFRAGDELVRIGERDAAFYIISEGRVEVVIPQPRGDRVVATIPEGSVFGEIAFFDGEPRSATIRARTAGSALRISRDRFDNLSGWNPALARRILLELGKVLALRLRRTTQSGRDPS